MLICQQIYLCAYLRTHVFTVASMHDCLRTCILSIATRMHKRMSPGGGEGLTEGLAPTEGGGWVQVLGIVGCATLKMLRRKSKTQFVKQERNTQNAIALLNYLKRIAP
jgi:hypothetical protein